MNVFEIAGECCTLDSAWFRGWRWLFSKDYRREVRARFRDHRWLLMAAGVLEALLLLLAQIAAVVLMVNWLI